MKKVRITLAAAFLAIAAVATVNAGSIEELYVFDKNGTYLNNSGATPQGCPDTPTEVLCATIYHPSQVEPAGGGTYRPKSVITPVGIYPLQQFKPEE